MIGSKHMRAAVGSLLAILTFAACGNSERAGAEEARREAEREQRAKRAASTPARRVTPPVPGQGKVPCSQLIDAAAFQAALGEKEPLAVKDVSRTEPDGSASCSLVRGGRRPSEADQKALIARNGRLGVLPGDEICNVTAFCSTIEDPERFQARCKQRHDQDDESLGSYACVHIVAVGADDVKVFRLFDDDTRCVLQVRGGPSNVNNELIQSCAKAARDAIGPAQIQLDPGAARPDSAAGSAGSAGSAG